MLLLGAAGLALAGAAAASARRDEYAGPDSGGGDVAGDDFFFAGYVPGYSAYAVPGDSPGDAGPAPAVAGSVSDFLNGLLVSVGLQSSRWLDVARAPDNAQYLQWLQAAELRAGIPALMLVRLAYQESRFRPDVINGQTVSSAGALGLMQIVPRWHPGVDPLDVPAAINYAADYLARLYRQFGSWELALQAYNWGPGNLQKFLRGELTSMPTETSNYSQQIIADAGAASGSVIV